MDIIKPNLEKYIEENIIDYFKSKNGYENVPEFMIRDVFKSYYNDNLDLKYECPEFMIWWYEMIQNINNYLLKTVTKNKEGYSFIALKHIIKMLRDEIENNEDFKNKVTKQDQEQKEPKEEEQKSQQALQAANENIKQQMKKIVEEASDEIDKQKATKDLFGDSAGKTPSEIEKTNDRISMIKDVVLNKKDITKFIAKSIKSFKTGFGLKTMLTEESLFEADGIEDIIDEYNLSHELLLLDAVVKDTKNLITKFDLYIDQSGSMNASININGKNIRRMNLAVTLAAKMEILGCLGDVYSFNTQIKPIDKNDIFNIYPRGGTRIENCLLQVKDNKRPSVILTDGEDHFDTYTENAFIMSIDPCGYSNYISEAYKKMVRNKKYVGYNGKKLFYPTL